MITKIGADGKALINTTMNANVIVDVVGWYSTATGYNAGEFTPVTPARITNQAVGVNQTISAHVTDAPGVPSTTNTVRAVAVNITVINPDNSGKLVAWPTGDTKPNTENVSYGNGISTTALSIVLVSGSGYISINSGRAATIYVDVVGWFSFTSHAEGTIFHPITPARLIDTTPNTGACTPSCTPAPTANSPSPSPTSTTCPDGSRPSRQRHRHQPRNDHVRLGWPRWNTTTPPVSPSPPAQPANTVIVPLGTDGDIAISATGSATDLHVDVNGYFTSAADTDTYTYTYDSDGLRTTKTGPDGTTTYAWATAAGSRTPHRRDHRQRRHPLRLRPRRHPARTDQPRRIRHLPPPRPTRLHPPPHQRHRRRHRSRNLQPLRHPSKPQPAHHNLGYAGQYTDPETGNQYLRARYYDPTTGQFLTRDPANGITRTAYGYTYGDPVNHADRNGLWPWDGMCVAIGNNGCDNSGTQNWAGNVLAGAGNALTFGQGVDLTAKLMGKGDNFTACNADSSSWAYRGGAVGAFALGGTVLGAGALGGGAEQGGAVTEETIRSAMQGADLSTTQRAVSIPRIQGMVDAMGAGDEFPAIHVDGNVIVDGNHRYIASRLTGSSLEAIQWPGAGGSRIRPLVRCVPRPIGVVMDIRCRTGLVVSIPGDSLVAARLDGLNLHRAQLAAAELDGSTSVGGPARAELDLAEMRGCVFDGANMATATASEAALANSTFHDTILVGAVFDHADLRNAELSSADVAGASFCGADMRGAHLGARRLDLADLRRARADSQTTFPQGFRADAAGVLFD